MARRVIRSGTTLTSEVSVDVGDVLVIESGASIYIDGRAVALQAEARLVNAGYITGSVESYGDAEIFNNGGGIRGNITARKDLRLINDSTYLTGVVDVSGSIDFRNLGTGLVGQDYQRFWSGGIHAFGGSIVNGVDATIIGGDFAVRMDGGVGGDSALPSRVENHGTMRSFSGTTVVFVGNNDDVLINSGEISTKRGDAAIDTGRGNDQIVNDGYVRGYIMTGDGDDTYDGSGTITAGIYLGSGNNTVNHAGIIERGGLATGDGDDIVINKGLVNGVISLGAGNDTYVGNATGSISVRGHLGNDRMVGSADANIFDGGAGDDILKGGAGDDLLIGGFDADVLTGGEGADTFFYGSSNATQKRSGFDRITDFNRADGDVIALDRIDADEGTAGDQAFAFIGSAAFSGSAGELRVAIQGHTSIVSGDTDGDGRADFAIVLTGHYQPADLQFIL